MLRAFVVTGSLVASVAGADDLSTGAVMPERATPNAILDTIDVPVQITTLFAPFDFPQAVAITDLEEVVGRVDDISVAGQDPDILVAFVGDWDRAIRVAFALESEALGARYQGLADSDFAVDYTIVNVSGVPLHVYSIAQDVASYEIPTLCWARLVVASLYVGAQPAPFTLRACAESL